MRPVASPWALPLLLLGLALLGCEDDGGTLEDAGLPRDAGVDAGHLDATAPDAEPDAGDPDAGELPEIDVDEVAPGAECAEYRARLRWPDRGETPLNWVVTGGALPAGLVLDVTTGTLHGRPTEAGAFSITVTVFDAENQTRSVTLELVIEAAAPASRWALVADEGLDPGPDDDEVRLLDVCGATPGVGVPLVTGQASLPYTGRAVSEQNAYSVQTNRVAVHVGRYDPLEIETVVFDLPSAADGLPQERLRTDGLLLGFGPAGRRVATLTAAEDIDVFEIPDAGDPARIDRMPGCSERCAVAWGPLEQRLATLVDGRLRVRWLEDGHEAETVTLTSARGLAFSADGRSVLTWAGPGDEVLEHELLPERRLGEATAFGDSWLDLDRARAGHPARRHVAVEGGAWIARDLEVWPRIGAPVRAVVEGARGALSGDGRRWLWMTETGEVGVAELDGPAPRAFELDLGDEGRRPFRQPDPFGAAVQWSVSGDRALFTGEYEGCGCVVGGAPPCPKVAITLERSEGGWRIAPELDVDAAELEQVCMDRGLPFLVAQGSLSIAPRGPFLAVSRIGLTFHRATDDGLEPWTRILEGTTSFFEVERWTPDGYAFATRRVWIYLGGLEPAAPVAVPGQQVTGVVMPPR